MDLDDAGAVARLDRGGMLSALSTYVSDFSASFAAGTQVRRPKSPLKNVVVSGMGGSGIAGDLSGQIGRATARVPMVASKEYVVPKFVDEGSLVIAVSYSGNTAETLAQAQTALGLNANVCTISSGGKLEEWANRASVPHVRVPGGRQPRAAIAHLLGAVLGVMDAASVVETSVGDLSGVAKLVQDWATHPTAENPAKQLGKALAQGFPVWYADPSLGPVAYRAKCQFNENAKMLAGHSVLPEANHNELAAWHAYGEGGASVAFLRANTESPPISARIEFLKEVLATKSVPTWEYKVSSQTGLAQMLEALALVDFVSVYAAFERGLDPTPIAVLDQLKQHLAASLG